MACIRVSSISSKRGCFTLKSIKACKRACRCCSSNECITGTPHNAGLWQDPIPPEAMTPVRVEQAVDPRGWMREVGVLQNRAVVAATELHPAPVCARTAPAVGHLGSPLLAMLALLFSPLVQNQVPFP